MTLIQVALDRAKKLAETTGTHRVPVRPLETPPPLVRERHSEPGAAAVAARAAQARTLQLAPVDVRVMERHGVLLQVSDTAAHRAYRILRTRVQQQLRAHGWHSLAVTAAGAGDGKTLTAINLAIALSRDVNTWVYIVDLDLQRPTVASYFGMRFDKGLSDYLAGTARFEDILYSPGVERLGVIPNARSMDQSSDVLGSPQVAELCRSLAAEVPLPIVIFDTPPLLLSDDVLRFYPNADCVLFVASEGATSRAVLPRAKEVLQEMNLLGVVLNRSAEREESGYY